MSWDNYADRDPKLPEDNKHPWLPDRLVDNRLDIKQLKEELAQARKNKEHLGPYPSHIVEALVNEIERLKEVHTIESGRACDRYYRERNNRLAYKKTLGVLL